MAKQCKNTNIPTTTTDRSLTLVTYNMHGYNQGFSTVNDLIKSSSVDIFLLQEHWLTPANMNKFSEMFPNYCGFGISAMAAKIESGPLIGRPFGGAIILVKNELLSAAECIYTAERFVIVRVGNLVIINVYLPCSGTVDRELIYNDLFAEISAWKTKYDYCDCILAGDFNCDLNSNCTASADVNKFLAVNNLVRCDALYKGSVNYTYLNEARQCCSTLDYIACDGVNVSKYDIIEASTNLSDHLPVLIVCDCCVDSINSSAAAAVNERQSVAYLRWDHADLIGYYSSTMGYLQSLLYELQTCEARGPIAYDDAVVFIEAI